MTTNFNKFTDNRHKKGDKKNLAPLSSQIIPLLSKYISAWPSQTAITPTGYQKKHWLKECVL
jgi:hypothetical protein